MPEYEIILLSLAASGDFGYMIECNGVVICRQPHDPEKPGSSPMTSDRALEAAQAEIDFRKSLEIAE